ncbi:MAG TPA: hypothetical protein PLB94_10860, partial [Microbacteriaceae bacterium]|nr:hypothetical protein [Microbacteriaceae bacterium]
GQAPKWNRGKCEGQAINADLGYARWVADLPRQPTGINGRAWCSDATRSLIAAALKPQHRTAATRPVHGPVAQDDIPF